MQSRKTRLRQARPARRWLNANELGYSLIEVLTTLPILLLVSGIFYVVLLKTHRISRRETTRSAVISTARNGMDLANRTVRNELVMFNTAAGTPLGVNFDLDQGGQPLVRDAVLFYVDQNRTALLYVFDDTGKPFMAGLDDLNGDGFADVIGIGLVRQDENGDNVQDFIDVDSNGQPDDIDGDGNTDPLWHVVMARFNRIDDATNPALWSSGAVLARNVYARRLNPAGPLVASNMDTFQFFAKSPAALLADTNGNKVLDESEIGNLVTADNVINQPGEVVMIDAVTLSIAAAEVAWRGGRPGLVQEVLSTHNITPRALALFRRNGIVGLVDPTIPANIN